MCNGAYTEKYKDPFSNSFQQERIVSEVKVEQR